MEEASQASTKVLVVGALSFLGSHIVYQLLEKGYHVRGTVSPTNPDYHTLVAAMEKVVSKLPGKLELVPLDILDESSWYRVFADIVYVFHLAAPRQIEAKHLTENMLPTVIGTRLMMQCAHNSKTVKKVIFTSCYCALVDSFDSSREYTEDDWNRESSLAQNSYQYSKTRAELLASHLANLPGCPFEFVSFVPGLLLGPPIIPRLSQSHDSLRLFLDGSITSMIKFYFPIADVRDTAQAHIHAMTTSAIQGRYCLSHPPMALPDMMRMIKNHFPKNAIPNAPNMTIWNFLATAGNRMEGDQSGSYWIYNIGKKLHINCTKARNASFLPLRPVNETIIDTVAYMIEQSLLDTPSKPRTYHCTIS